MADDGLLEAVRGLHLAHPELGPKPLLAKLREQQPDLAAGNKEVREALAALKAEESKPTEAAAAPPPPPAAAAAPPLPRSAARHRTLRLASLASAAPGCRQRWATAVRSIRSCPICRELKIPTTYWCDVNCPGNPGAWKRHAPVHKAVRQQRERSEDGGVMQQRHREVAEEAARHAAQTGDAYEELLAEGVRYASQQDIAEQPGPSARPSR